MELVKFCCLGSVTSPAQTDTSDRRCIMDDTVPQTEFQRNFYTVYALIDPRDTAVRYIGITYDVYQRMRQHSRCEGNNVAKNAWIHDLQQEQLMFILYSLEKVKTFEKALVQEIYWIERCLEQGADLLNRANVPAQQQS